jgi:hypothetical protein
LREESTSFLKKRSKKLFESGSGALSWAAKYPNKPVMPAKAGIHDFSVSVSCRAEKRSAFRRLWHKKLCIFSFLSRNRRKARVNCSEYCFVFKKAAPTYGFSFALF